MAASPKATAVAMLDALMAKDLARMNELLADDIVFYDPHYPTPTIFGREAMNANMGWAFGFLKSMHWDVLHAWEDATSAVLEVATHHEMPDGTPVTPPQCFVVEVSDGKITRWTSYVPYPPPAPPAQ